MISETLIKKYSGLKFSFGKYKGQPFNTPMVLQDYKYLFWLHENMVKFNNKYINSMLDDLEKDGLFRGM